MATKRIPIYFYYVNVMPIGNGAGDTELNWDTFLNDFREMLGNLENVDLPQRKETFEKDERVVWLDSCPKLNNCEIDLVIKSAKYNHVRDVIDTENMTEKGQLKNPCDGDEEKTHLCLRYHSSNEQMICLFGSNYYGVAIGKVLTYLSIKMQKWCTEQQKPSSYSFGKEIMPGDEFLRELRRMDKISLVTLTLDTNDFQDDFLHLAGRDEARKTVDVQIRKARRSVNIPLNLVENYYQETGAQQKIKKLTVEGRNDSGSIKIDTESIQMKQAIDVELSEYTREIVSSSFFTEAQAILDSMRISAS
jgi:hypothetical protein